jgi:hypothetical protein
MRLPAGHFRTAGMAAAAGERLQPDVLFHPKKLLRLGVDGKMRCAQN